ncbi:MAG TPA: adenylate/guanylate cyclase domain-containing protein [Candidatus Sulfotelmatobacter sp.]|nr:adenylate/guanylate cyclase domain-containing protein [Candidatus Sulfotelmatobacter sp.]
MQFKQPKRAPLILAVLVLAFVCGIRIWNPDLIDRAERMTYDLRVRHAQKIPAPVATNLAFVAIEDSSIAAVNSGKVGALKLGYQSGLYWQRQIYGRLVEELSAQGAKAVSFDVLFGELRPDHPPVQLADGSLIESDEYFAAQSYRAGNVLLAGTPEVVPPDLFITNAVALGDISTEKDSDGILRRARAFNDIRRWHYLIQKLAELPEVKAELSRAAFVPGKILIPQNGTTNIIEIPVDADNNFQVADFIGDKLPPGMAPKAKAFTTRRIWHMGIVLAAQELNLDLATADVDLPHGKIVLHGTGGLTRVIPVDRDGFFYVDWRLTPDDTRLTRAPMEFLLAQDRLRLLGETNDLRDDFRGKLVIIGSAAQGNDLTDRGATPLERNTLLVSKHWNVANSVITGRFIQCAPLVAEFLIIVLLGAFTAIITWQLRAVAASVTVALLMAAYYGAAVYAFDHFRWWLPVVYPLAGAMLAMHVVLMINLVMFEEQDKRRVKFIFSKMIAPEVVNELLRAEKLSLGGSHREVTVFFADVRGFTALTDQRQEAVADFIRTRQLDEATAEKFFEESARETLETVNLYLAAVAEVIKKNGGTLDKYIGDCVMAFWNAPGANPQHAVCAVRAAIDAQRAINELNLKREAENPGRQAENQLRAADGRPALQLHTALHLGTGINSGLVTVGLMGSEEHGFNYTVFGREVNLASRLEGVSGSGRIIISDLTYFQLLRHAPELAATCKELMPVQPKGFANPVRIYEVPWQNK